MVRLYNTLTRKVEEFTAINSPKVGLYTCGPTVYDFAHIGNYRTYIFEDILQRVLEASGYQVFRVMNITDIDDKIIRSASQKKLSIGDFSAPFEEAFYQDLEKLNLKPANVYPKATEHIGQMIKYIKILLKKGLAYREKDGSVYFDISKFARYGKLSGVNGRNLKSGTRILSDEYSKDDVQDFALWKSVGADEVGYPSSWGRGRPGWHIECSVMSQEYLGETFDIHAGGVDLLFPHHENEIAQSEGKTGKKFVNFFVEGEHLLVDSQKMSKSLGNVYTLKDIESRGFDPLAFKYLCLTAHYRDKLNFTWESLRSAQNALNNLRSEIRLWSQTKDIVAQFWQKFLEAANSDLNIPQALAVMWKMVKSDLPSGEKLATLLKMDQVLGFNLAQYIGKPVEVPDKVQRLIEEREKIRQSGNYQKSDSLRGKIESLGFELKDTTEGTVVKKKDG